MSVAPDIVTVKLSDIAEYDKNPRDNSAAVEAVAKSITDFGFLVPIVIDANNVIVAGHTRYQASLLLELEEVPVIKAEHLSEEQANSFRLIDNKTAELADWDFDLLASEIAALSDSGIDLVPFGWTEEEVDCLSQIVADDCIADLSDDDALKQRQDGDGVNSAAQGNRGSSAISKDPKSVRVAIGEINFFVDIEQYREWAHNVRKHNNFDMASIQNDLAARLGLSARPLRRNAVKAEEKKVVEDAKPKRKRPAKAKTIDKTPKREKVTRKRKRPETKLREAVDEIEDA